MSEIAKILVRAKILTAEVIVGYENEQQKGWPENAKVHLCQVCYESAKKLREAIKELEQVKP